MVEKIDVTEFYRQIDIISKTLNTAIDPITEKARSVIIEALNIAGVIEQIDKDLAEKLISKMVLKASNVLEHAILERIFCRFPDLNTET